MGPFRHTKASRVSSPTQLFLIPLRPEKYASIKSTQSRLPSEFGRCASPSLLPTWGVRPAPAHTRKEFQEHNETSRLVPATINRAAKKPRSSGEDTYVPSRRFLLVCLVSRLLGCHVPNNNTTDK